MSIESAKSFIERMKTDEKFAKKVTSFNNAEERMSFVKENGYEFTDHEIHTIITNMSDDELDVITGGTATCMNYIAGGRKPCGLMSNPPL